MPDYGEPLSEREKELLQMVATGVTNREIAYRLSISVNTVKVHLRNIFTKLGAESRTEATMIAVREGWITVGNLVAPPPTPVEAGGEDVVPAAPPLPPLPWARRAALIFALLWAAFCVAVTWPRSAARSGNGHDLPVDLLAAETRPVVAANDDSPWRERAQMPTRRACFALAVAEERLYAIAGQTTEGVSGAVEIYDPAENLWSRGEEKPTPVMYVSAAALGSDIYVPGGCDADGVPTRTVEVYNARGDAWQQVNPLPEPRCAYALAALEGKLYLFGGWDGSRYVASVFIYDPAQDVWNRGTAMDAARGLAAAAPLDGRLYVAGGYDGKRELSTCAVYDPATATWEACAPLLVGRGGLGLVNLGNQLYAIGGGGWTSYLGFNERYNPLEDAWQTFSSPWEGVWRCPGVVAFGNSIYAIGGWNTAGYLGVNESYTTFRVFIPVSQ